MTNEEMNELDRWLAENPMGWEFAFTKETWTDKSRAAYWSKKSEKYELVYYADGWHPTRNIAQAFQVVEKMLNTTYGFTLDCPIGSMCFAQFYSDIEYENWIELGETPALAICLAAKKAWEAK